VTHKVRVVTIDGAPWFVAADVCRVLGMDLAAGTSQWLVGLATDEKHKATRRDLPELFSGTSAGSLTIISEPGLYKLIMRSNKLVARPFQDWVTREVLPAIRETGGYMLAGVTVMVMPTSFAEVCRRRAVALIQQSASRQDFGRRPRRPVVRGADARSAWMRSNSTDAGSSFGSCGTSSPRNALARIAWSRRSMSLRALVASAARRSIQVRALLTEATIWIRPSSSGQSMSNDASF
jgi:prophage antirepressor-like protein